MAIVWQEMEIPEKRKRVSALADKGYSAAQIAAKLNAPSRNAVIGFCDRQKIKLVGSNIIPLQTGKPRRKKEKAKSGSAEIIVLEKKKAAKKPSIPAKGKLNIEQMPFLGRCRGPLNDDYRGVKPSKMMFCGEVTVPGSSWCPDCRKKYVTGTVKTMVPKDTSGLRKEPSKAAKSFMRWHR